MRLVKTWDPGYWECPVALTRTSAMTCGDSPSVGMFLATWSAAHQGVSIKGAPASYLSWPRHHQTCLKPVVLAWQVIKCHDRNSLKPVLSSGGVPWSSYWNTPSCHGKSRPYRSIGEHRGRGTRNPLSNSGALAMGSLEAGVRQECHWAIKPSITMTTMVHDEWLVISYDEWLL